MRRLRTLPTRRLWAIVAAVAALAAGGGIAQAALGGSPKPAPKPLDRAVLDALRAPAVNGITARIRFTNGLLPSGSLPDGSSSPLLAGASGRLWLTDDGRARLELQSDSGDAQIVLNGDQLRYYDARANTVYRITLPAGHGKTERAHHEQRPTLEGVRSALYRLSKTWSLSGARPTSTAGRPTYTVRISPRDDGGLLGAAELAWDAEKGLPLRAAIYAQGQSDPVLALEATDISYGPVPAHDVTPPTPAGAKVENVDLAGMHAKAPRGHATRVHGVAAVRQALDFPLAAPRHLAGLPRTSVRLVRLQDNSAALSTYGDGLGAIAVLQQRSERRNGAGGGLPGGIRLPQVNIDGASGSELSTPLGTFVTFERNGVSYVVAGSVPPLAAENAARGLK
jgi:outer membrane lipoprotein-sorting protein